MQKALTQMSIQLANKNNPHFQLADELQRITRVDLTRIDAGDVPAFIRA
jgi:hypothetical protein